MPKKERKEMKNGIKYFMIVWNIPHCLGGKLMWLIRFCVGDPSKRVKDNMDLAKVMSRAILQR